MGFAINFYDFLEISRDATSQEIKKAYRKMSLKLHPDKNPAANAEMLFTRLAAVYEVLQDEDKRRSYDNLLVNGMPTVCRTTPRIAIAAWQAAHIHRQSAFGCAVAKQHLLHAKNAQARPWPARGSPPRCAPRRLAGRSLGPVL